MTEDEILWPDTAVMMMERVASVFASYKVDPHDEGAPVQEVVDHLIRCIGFLLPDGDRAWFTSRAALDMPLWRYEAPVD